MCDCLWPLLFAERCDFLGLWLTAPDETLIARVEQRQGDASDADRRVVKEQLGYDLGEITWSQIDAGGAPEAVMAAALGKLSEAGVSLAEPAPPPP